MYRIALLVVAVITVLALAWPTPSASQTPGKIHDLTDFCPFPVTPDNH